MLHPVIDSLRRLYYHELIGMVPEENRDQINLYLTDQPNILIQPSSPIEYSVLGQTLPYHDPIFPVNRPNKDALRDLDEDTQRAIDKRLDEMLLELSKITQNASELKYEILPLGNVSSRIIIENADQLDEEIHRVFDGPIDDSNTAQITANLSPVLFIDTFIARSSMDRLGLLHAIMMRYDVILAISEVSESTYPLDDRFISMINRDIDSIYDASLDRRSLVRIRGMFIKPSSALSEYSRSNSTLVMRPPRDIITSRELYSDMLEKMNELSGLRVISYVDPILDPELYQILKSSEKFKSEQMVPLEDSTDPLYMTLTLGH